MRLKALGDYTSGASLRLAQNIRLLYVVPIPKLRKIRPVAARLRAGAGFLAGTPCKLFVRVRYSGKAPQLQTLQR